MIKVAIIGCGSITEFRHAPEYHANPHVEIAAFCDPVPGRAERLAGIYGGAAYTNYEDVLALKGVDAVSVCTSNSTHAEVTVKALLAGKHVLCEKPMATNLQDARLMTKTAERCGKILMLGHNQRLAPAHTKAKELLESGLTGRVLTFKTTFGHGGPESWSKDKGAGTWFFKKSAASLGALGDLGVHKADLIRYLLGEEIDEVFCAAAAMDKKYETGEPIDVEDNAVCVLKSHSGVSGTLTVSWTYYGAEDNSTILYCQNGILRIFASKEEPLSFERRDGSKELYDVGGIQTNDNQMSTGVIDAFIKAIVTGSSPAVTGEDGYEALSIALACSQSAKAGEHVSVSHYNGTERSPFAAQRQHPAYAVHSLRMETNLTPERPDIHPVGRFCDETYPGFTIHRKARDVDDTWRRRVGMELGGKLN